MKLTINYWGKIMNKLLVILLIFAFNAQATTGSLSEFDEAACQGDTISDERALELLGSNSSVRLNDGRDPLYYRVRQKINGKVGKWSDRMPVNYYLSTSIFNNKGQLGFDFKVINVPINCRLVDSVNTPNKTYLRCDPNEDNTVHLNSWGSGMFTGKITDHCIQLKSAMSDEGADYEWVYLVQY